jgi:hypothetical protein
MGPLGRCIAGGLLLALAAAGCGDIDGSTEPFPGTALYTDPQGAFTLRLLQPPWLPGFKYQGLTYLAVPGEDTPITTDPAVILPLALYILLIDSQGGGPVAALQMMKSGLPASAQAVERTVTTASGATGSELSWTESATRFHRDVFLSAPGTPTFHLNFTAKRDIADDAMVSQMIASFTPQ